LNLTDTHCHLDIAAFDDDRGEVLARARAAGVKGILVPALDMESSRSAIALAAAHPDVFAAIGVHPTEVARCEADYLVQLRELAGPGGTPSRNQSEDHGRVSIVAVGEIGLDYYWDAAPHELQRERLRAQLTLAQELELPVVIHARERGDAESGPCSEDLLRILSDWTVELHRDGSNLAQRPGVWHSFGGSVAAAKEACRLGFYLGVTGPITYPRAAARRTVIATLPTQSLLIETDSPHMAPAPRRGRRNEPAFVAHIADKIAEIHMTTVEIIANVTTSNASRLFGWPG
jgi:TatD DNase family protein